MTGSFSGQVMTILSFFLPDRLGCALILVQSCRREESAVRRKKAISDQSGWLEMAYGWKDKVSLSFHTAYV